MIAVLLLHAVARCAFSVFFALLGCFIEREAVAAAVAMLRCDAAVSFFAFSFRFFCRSSAADNCTLLELFGSVEFVDDELSSEGMDNPDTVLETAPLQLVSSTESVLSRLLYR